MNLIFATANLHKREEVEPLLPLGINISTLLDVGITEDIPEEEPTIEGNASAKAWYVFNKTGRNCFADDTGLEVEVLNGEPGVRSARYASDSHDFDANVTLLLSKLQGITNRRARFRTVISLIIDGVEHQFTGEAQGIIIEERNGDEGFGYDPVFRPDGHDKTFAQMTTTDKNAISHRALATAKLVEFLTINFQQINDTPDNSLKTMTTDTVY